MELDSISVNKLASLFPEVDLASTTELVLTILELEQDRISFSMLNINYSSAA